MDPIYSELCLPLALTVPRPGAGRLPQFPLTLGWDRALSAYVQPACPANWGTLQESGAATCVPGPTSHAAGWDAVSWPFGIQREGSLGPALAYFHLQSPGLPGPAPGMRRGASSWQLLPPAQLVPAWGLDRAALRLPVLCLPREP